MPQKNVVDPSDDSLADKKAIVPCITSGDWVFLSGVTGVNDETESGCDFDVQARQAFQKIDQILEAAGSSLEDIVQMTVWFTDLRFVEEFSDIRSALIDHEIASTFIGSHGLSNQEARVEIEVKALQHDSKLNKQIIEGEDGGTFPDDITAPGIKVGDLIFLSSQTGVDGTGEVSSQKFPDQMESVMENVKSYLELGGSSWGDVLHMTTWMTDLRNTEHFTNVRSAYLDEDVTTSTRIGVPELWDSELKVEMEVIGVDSSVGKTLVDHPDELPLSTTTRDGETYPRYWQCVSSGDWVFTAGMVGVDTEFNPVAKDFLPQARRTLESIEIALQAAGLSREDLLHTRTYLTDMRYYDQYISLYDAFFSDVKSTASIVQSPALAQEPLKIEVEAIAMAPS